MTGFKFKSLMLACAVGVSLGGCFGGDSTSDLASPGNTGSNPGTPGGGNGGGGTDPGGPSAGDCPTGTTVVDVGTAKHCLLSGTITQDVTLTAGNIYQLANGNVFVGRDVGPRGDAANGLGVTLTVQPGVTIYGQARSQLAVQRGSKLVANGTAASPIIFTSAQDAGFASVLPAANVTSTRAPFTGFAPNDQYSGEWGGVQLLGRARLNTCTAPAVCEETSEGDAGVYGGNLDTDNSGSLRFVQIRYAGFQITSTNELNSLALWGVGSGTTVENIHIHNGGDDNIEFFGGTVDVKRLVLTGAGDDTFDWTYGWRGKAQFVLILQGKARADTDAGIEADNYSNNNAEPRSNPTLSNFTLIGRGSSPATIAMRLRVGTSAQVYNTVIGDGWPTSGIQVESARSQGDLGQPGGINLRSVYNSATTPFAPSAFAETLRAYFLTPGLNNAVGVSTLTAYASAAGAPAYVNGANENAVTHFDVTTLDGFFEPVNYIGAVGSRSTNWTVGWTFGLN